MGKTYDARGRRGPPVRSTVMRRGDVVRSAKLVKNAARANIYAPLTVKCGGICRDEVAIHQLVNGMCESCRKVLSVTR